MSNRGGEGVPPNLCQLANQTPCELAVFGKNNSTRAIQVHVQAADYQNVYQGSQKRDLAGGKMYVLKTALSVIV